MTSKTFTSGTVIDKDWLNDVNTQTYGGVSGALGTPYLPTGTGTVLTSVQELLNNSVSTSIFNFLSDTEKTDVVAGTRTNDLQAKFQTAVNTCMLFGWNLHIPSHAKSIKIGSPVVIDYTVLGTGTLSIWGDAVKGYYQGGAGSELYYSGTTGYIFQVTGRLADVGGTNEGSPMSVSFEGINFAGNNSAYGACSFSRASFCSVRKNNFYGFGNTTNGTVVVSASGVTVGSPIAFCGEIDIVDNHFASSGRCVVLTGNTGGVVNVVRITDNVALDQNYFVSVDFGGGIPYSESIWITGNHVEGTILNDVYSQGAASNFRVVGNYFEQNRSANNGPRVNVQGSNNVGIYVEQNTFSKSLATTAGTSLVTITNADGVSVVNNQSNYGGAIDRFSVDLVSCVNAVAEPFSAVALPLYPVRMNNYVMQTGRVTDQWKTNPLAGSGGFIGISSGDGYPGGTVCTIAVEQSKNNAQVRLNFKATITTKSISGTSSLIGVLPYANYGTDVYFPVYATNAVGTKPFYGVLPAGLTVATIYDATGAALNYQTAFSVGSVINANFTYLTQQ